MSILLILYLAKATLVSGLLYAYYRWLLCNRRFHRFNRFFLLSIPLFSLVTPLVHLPFGASVWPAEVTIPGLFGPHPVMDGHWQETDAATSPAPNGSMRYSWQLLTAGTYILVSTLLLYGLFRQLRYIRLLTTKYPREKMGDIYFFNTNEPGAPFSFLRYIFWNDQMPLDNAACRQIFRHELSHVHQKHSIDLLLLRALTALCWINPFFHLICREIRAVHEFLADDEAVSEGDRYQYAESLVWQTMRTPSISLSHPFFQSPIKRRINMITQSNHTRTNRPAGQAVLGRALIFPLLFLLICAFGTKHHPLPGNSTADKPLTVVIDAGHGGVDPGAVNKTGMQEKNINLSIAGKIKSLSKEYNVNVLMTREKDELAGGRSTAAESLRYRSEMANDNKADLFISIHTDMNASEYVKGFSIFVAEQNAHYTQCVQLGSAIIESLKKNYPTETALKKRKENIYVLRETQMPAVLLQCGNLNNEKDLSFISKEENQELVARDILQGIRDYAAANRTGKGQ